VTERVPKVVGPEQVEDAVPVGVVREKEPSRARERGVAAAKDKVVKVEEVRANRTARDQEENNREGVRAPFPKGGKSCQVEIGQARWAKVP
jgi:hypothetical protein